MVRISPYQHLSMGAVVFGAGAATQLNQQRPLRRTGQLLVVSDQGVAAAGILSRVVDGLGERVKMTDVDCVPDGDVRHVEELAERARAQGIDGIVAVGGGSVMDSAKAVAVLLTKGGKLTDYEGIAKVRSPLVPVVCVPTTSGTGAEGTQFIVLMDREQGRKVILIDNSLVPALAVLDPELTLGLPAAVTAATGVDALTHAVEAMGSRMRNPFGVALAMEAARIIVADGALERVLRHPDDLDARGQMLSAAAMAGQAINTCMLGACHAFAHALGAMRGVPHGVANGLFLVPIMRFNVPKARAVYARLGAALGGQGDESGLVEHALLCVEQTVHDVAGVPRRLRDLEVSEAELATLAKAALTDPDVQTNPVQLTDLDRAVEIVQAIW